MIAREALGQEALQSSSHASHLVGDKLLDVDCIEEGLADAVVVEGLLHGVEHQEGQGEGVQGLSSGAGLLDEVDVGSGDALHDLCGCLGEVLGASGLVGDDVPVHGSGGCGVRAVVVGVGLEVDGSAGVEVAGLDDPGAGAQEGALVQILLRGALGEHAAGGQAALEQGLCGVLEHNADAVALLGDLVDEAQEGSVESVLHLDLDGVDDVCRGDVGAVRELGTLAQGDVVLGLGDLLGLARSQCRVGLVGVVVEVVESLAGVAVSCHDSCSADANGGVGVGGGVADGCGQGTTLDSLALSCALLLLAAAAATKGQDDGARCCGACRQEAPAANVHLCHMILQIIPSSPTGPIRQKGISAPSLRRCPHFALS